MKTYLITIAFLFSCSTWAENVKVPVGVFKFNHEINILLAKKTEWIDSRNQAGKERVKELIAQAWECVAQTAVTFKCSRSFKNEHLPAQLKQKVEVKFKDSQANFALKNTVGLVSEGEVIKEYVVSQEVEINEHRFSFYELKKNDAGPFQLRFREHSEIKEFYLNIISENTIASVITETLTEKSKSITYFLEVLLQK